jgi:stage II sporulation protein GA (sporulation sigma-E factor processing peptidase)
MTVYLEDVIIENILINSMLLYFVCKTVKRYPVFWRVIWASIIGTVFAVVLPLLNYPEAFSVLIKLAVGAVMVLAAGFGKSIIKFILFYTLFLVYTFSFGGAVYAFGNAYVLIAVGFMFIFLIQFLNLRHSISQSLRDCVIYYGSNKFKINCLYDTGNRLIDPKSKAPVCIISLSFFLKMFPDVEIDKLIMNKLGDEIKDGHYINFTTVAKAGKMFVFAPDKLEVAGGLTTGNVRLGVALNSFRGAVKYDALLNANL